MGIKEKKKTHKENNLLSSRTMVLKIDPVTMLLERKHSQDKDEEAFKNQKGQD